MRVNAVVGRCAGVVAAAGVVFAGAGCSSQHNGGGGDGGDAAQGTTDVSTLADIATTADVAALQDVAQADVQVSAPRPLAPLSSSVVRSVRPSLRVGVPSGASGVSVQLCADRACATVEQTVPATSGLVTPTADLAPGVHFWRLVDSMGTPSATWELFVRPGVGSQRADTVEGAVEDLDGDGFADLLVAATHADGEAGRLYGWSGRTGVTARAPDLSLAAPDHGPGAGHFGWSAVGAGDLDGDGYDDLVVAAPDLGSGAGRVYIYRGGAAGIASTPSTTLMAPDPTGGFGTALATGGDLDGDGYGDLVVASPNAASSAGTVYVFRGGPAGPGPAPSVALASPDGPASTFGAALALVGDANGDGFADLVVGAPNARDGMGAAHVYYGGVGAPRALPDEDLPSPTTEYAQYGTSVAAAGDVNGDGLADAIVGAPQSTAGSAFVYQGARGGYAPAPSASFTGPDGERGNFGWAAAHAGDVDGDGFADVAVAAVCAVFHPDPDGGYPTCGPGRVYVYRGGASGLGATPSTTLEGPSGEPGLFGWSVVGAHDLDHDGVDDLAVAAIATRSYSGAAFVYRGSSAGLVSTPAVQLTGSDAAGNFGWTIALNGATRDGRARRL